MGGLQKYRKMLSDEFLQRCTHLYGQRDFPTAKRKKYALEHLDLINSVFFKLLNPVNYRNSPRSGEKITGLIYRNSAPKAPGPKITGFRREAAIFFKNYMIFTGFQQKLQEFYRNSRKLQE